MLLKFCTLFEEKKEEEIKSGRKTNIYLKSPLDAFNNFGKEAEYNPVEMPSFRGIISGIDKDGVVRINRYDLRGNYDGCCKAYYYKIRLIN